VAKVKERRRKRRKKTVDKKRKKNQEKKDDKIKEGDKEIGDLEQREESSKVQRRS